MFFFFSSRRRHTRCSRDWSSDVCSSDLTLNDQLAPFLGKVKAALTYALGRRGPLAMSVNQAGAFLRSRAELTRPNLHIYFNPASYSTTTIGANRRLLNPDPFPGFLMSFNTCRPTSRGSVHIRSSDPLDS